MNGVAIIGSAAADGAAAALSIVNIDIGILPTAAENAQVQPADAVPVDVAGE